MKNPVLYMLIAYIAGIFAAKMLDFSIIVFAVIFMFIISIIKLIVKKRDAFGLCLMAVMFIAGNAAYCISYHDVFSPLNDFRNEYVTVTGRMCEIPDYDAVNDKSKITIITNEVEYKDKSYYVKDKVVISVPGKYAYGLVVRVSGFLAEFDESSNTAGYDSKMNNRIKGISYRIFSETLDIQTAESVPESVYDAYNMLKFRAMRIIDLNFSDEDAALLHIILFGDYRNLSGSLNEKINRSNAGRFLRSAYISMLILTFLVDTAALNLSVPKKYRIITVIAAVLIFVLLNNNSPSFVRSGVFFVVYSIYTQKFGYLYKPDAIPLGILIILLFDPLMLFSRGFVMSVLSCVMLYLFKPHIVKYLKKYISSAYLRNSTAVWMICTLGLIPVSAYCYRCVSAYTLIYSLLFPPLIIAVLFCMPIVLVMFGSIHTAPVFYHIVIFALFIIRRTIGLVYALPFSEVIVPKPPVLIIISYFAAVYLLYLKAEKENKTIFYDILKTVCIVFVIISVLTGFSNYGRMYIHFINVGHGDSALIDISGKEKVLIDGGGSEVYSSYLVGEEIVVPYIESVCGENIDTVVVSHYHKDHCDGVIDVLLSCRVKRIVLPDCAEDNEYRIMLEKAADRSGCEIIYASEELEVSYRSGMKLKILPPEEELTDSEDMNNTSLAVLLTYGSFSALFTGDMYAEGEKKLIGMEDMKSVDVLKVGHHGSATSSDEDFIEYVSPLISVVSVGDDDSYNLPDHDVIERIEKYSGKLLRTDENGDIAVISDKKGLKGIRVMKK